jgi:undecaprenyl-diphosphatase
VGWLEAAILGIVQGLTEFLPISSNAHMRIVAAFMSWKDPGAAFSAVIQVGTELAVIIYFRHDIIQIIKTWFNSLRNRELRSDPLAKLGWFVILGSIPIGILGLALQDPIAKGFRDLRLVAMALLFFAIVIGFVDQRARTARSLESLTTKEALVFGFAQSLALIPGVSRSGGTIAAGLAMGFKREAAARYSFLLAIPAVMASGGLELAKIGSGNSPAWGPTILATCIAFVVAYVVIGWLLKFLVTHTFRWFVIYRVILGLVVLGAVASGFIPAS